MPDYRRYRVPGGTYFFTLNLLERRSDLLIRHIELGNTAKPSAPPWTTLSTTPKYFQTGGVHIQTR